MALTSQGATAPTPAPSYILRLHQDAINALAYSEDGSRLFSWCVSLRHVLHEIMAHPERAVMQMAMWQSGLLTRSDLCTSGKRTKAACSQWHPSAAASSRTLSFFHFLVHDPSTY